MRTTIGIISLVAALIGFLTILHSAIVGDRAVKALIDTYGGKITTTSDTCTNPHANSSMESWETSQAYSTLAGCTSSLTVPLAFLDSLSACKPRNHEPAPA